MNNLTHFLNGKFVSESELLISPRDLGFIRGYAVADFIVTYQNKPFLLDKHIDRLFESAKIIGLIIPWTKIQIATWANESLNKNDKETEKTIKIILSGGESDSMRQETDPTIAIIISARKMPSAQIYESGIKTIAIKYMRPYPKSKHTHYVESIRQLNMSEDNDINDIIYYDDTQVFEGAGNNIFAVIEDKLVTPKSNIVEGVTRNILLDILKLSIPIEVRDFNYNELLGASEIFLTGSNTEVRGVIEMNKRVVGNGKVGKITKEILKQYRKYISKITNTIKPK